MLFEPGPCLSLWLGPRTNKQVKLKAQIYLLRAMYLMASFPFMLRASLHRGPWSRTMEDGLFPWSDYMVWLSWSDFLKNQFTKLLGLHLGVKFIVDQKEWPCTRKWMCLFFNIWLKRQFSQKQSWTILLSSLVFVFSLPPRPKIKIHWTFIITTFFVMDPCLFLLERLLCLSHYNHVGPCQWIRL